MRDALAESTIMEKIIVAAIMLGGILLVLNSFGLIGDKAPLLFTDCSNAWSPALRSRCAADESSYAQRR